MCGVLQAKREYCELLPIPCTDGAVVHEPPTGQRLSHMQMPSQRDLLCRLSSTMHPQPLKESWSKCELVWLGSPSHPDDRMIHNNTFHMRLCIVLKRLKAAGLKLNPNAACSRLAFYLATWSGAKASPLNRRCKDKIAAVRILHRRCKGPFTQAIFAAILVAISNRPCKLAAILWRIENSNRREIAAVSNLLELSCDFAAIFAWKVTDSYIAAVRIKPPL